VASLNLGQGRATFVCVLIAGALVTSPSTGHESGFTTLRVEVIEERVVGEWELAVRDARALLGIDLDSIVPLSVGDERALAALLAARVVLAGDAVGCPLDVSMPSVKAVPGSRESIAFPIEALCAAPIRSLSIHYPILFDLDPKHRGYYSVRDSRRFQAGVFTLERQETTVDIRQLDRVQTFREYAREGVRHILSGVDHVLFLVALLLPSVLAGGPPATGGGGGSPGLRTVALRVAGIVTAFTLAHSVTLTLAVLDVVRLPARHVEAAIAASVFVAAWHNVRPFLFFRRPGLWMAFGFGLLHGLGFANALAQLGLPRHAKALALLAFNLGVEAGQLAIVALLLPVLYALRARPAYRTWGVRVASLLIAWLALVWLIERAFGVELLPWL
jgi:hypothetical protein